MGEKLTDDIRPLFQAPVFVVMTTINPDGQPQSSVVWAKLDGDQVIISTIRGRRKCLNMERDPRITLIAYDPSDPYIYVELRGTVTLDEQGGRELIEELSQLYDGKPFPVREEVRVVVRFTATKIVRHQ